MKLPAIPRRALRLVIASLIIALATAGCSKNTANDAANDTVNSSAAESQTPLQPAQNMTEYQALSEQLYRMDQAQLKAEVAEVGLEKIAKPSKTKRFGFDAKKAATDSEFFHTDEGRQIAENLLSFQTPSGGWSKRTDMGIPREKGQHFGVEKKYVPTLDNLATSTQFWAMANACNTLNESRYCESATRALRYIVIAQYPNGGWPQNFPLRGGYHDDITYNDDAITSVLTILAAVAEGDPRLAFIPTELQKQARTSLQRGLKVVVATQVVINGEPTIWGAQHHAETFAPTAARAFEPAALATAESADLVLFLMTLNKPSEPIRNAIDAAVIWFEKHQIDGLRYHRRAALPALEADETAPPIWGRFYTVDSKRPVFGDREGKEYFDVEQVSAERRQGYAWYTGQPKKVLKKYAEWRER